MSFGQRSCDTPKALCGLQVTYSNLIMFLQKINTQYRDQVEVGVVTVVRYRDLIGVGVVTDV